MLVMLIFPSKPERHRNLIGPEGSLDSAQGIDQRIIDLKIVPPVREADGGQLILPLTESDAATVAEAAVRPALSPHIQAILTRGEFPRGHLHIHGGVFRAAGEPRFVN